MAATRNRPVSFMGDGLTRVFNESPSKMRVKPGLGKANSDIQLPPRRVVKDRELFSRRTHSLRQIFIDFVIVLYDPRDLVAMISLPPQRCIGKALSFCAY